MEKIIFTQVKPGMSDFPPKPAIKSLPTWFKNMAPEMSDEEKIRVGFEDPMHPVGGTLKQCIPVLDALTSGYILFSPTDLIITQRGGQPYYEWQGAHPLIAGNPKEQAPGHPAVNTESIPKWINIYGIKTPKGYSCLFTHPFHRDDLPFRTMSGVVDTDRYTNTVLLPFTLKDPNFVGHIPAGTPIAQVIPFKRTSWEHEFGSELELKEANNIAWRLQKLKEFKYKHSWWERKSYR